MRSVEKQTGENIREYPGKRMVYRILMITLLILVWGCFGETVQAEETDMDELRQDLLRELDFDDVDTILRSQDLTKKVSFDSIVEQLLDTDQQIEKRDLVEEITHLVISDVAQWKSIFVQILLLTIAFSFFHHFMHVFENSQVSKMGFLMYFLVLIVMLMKSYSVMYQITESVLHQIIDLMQALIPAFCMTMVFAAARTTAMIFYQLAMVTIWLVERILLYVIIPGIHIYVVLEMLNHLTGEKMISRFTSLLKNIIKWALRVMLAGVTGMNIVENMIAPSIDNLQKLSITKTLGMIPGLGGTAEAVSNLLLGSAMVIKNGVGAAAMVVLLLVCLGPMVKMLVFALLYKLAGAFVQPLTDQRICGALDCVGEGAGMMLKTVVTGILLFLITVGVVITAVK